jgi:hypothetical protein
VLDQAQERYEIVARVRGGDIGYHSAARHVERREEVASAVADIVVGGARWGGGEHRQRSAVRFMAWIWGFSSTAKTAAATGEDKRLPRPEPTPPFAQAADK